jgi:hypothetical protein
MSTDRWWKAKKNSVHTAAWTAVSRIEQEQSGIFERFRKLEALYDPYGADTTADGRDLANVTENVIASNVDTATAEIAITEIRARFMTDGADWQQQRRARHLEWYAEEQQKLLDILGKCRLGFKEAAKKGTGITFVTEKHGAPCVEHVMVENLVIPEEECRDGRTPRQLHRWERVDADELIALYPKFIDKIESARNSRRGRRLVTSSRPLTSSTNDVLVLHSWRLPIGTKGQKGYVSGRYAMTIESATLEDREYHKSCFPAAIMWWSERAESWYGIGGAERIAGIQRALNKRNWQIERVLDQNALLTTYVRPADANLTIKTSRAGNIGVVKGDYPHTPNPPLVSAETYQSRHDLRGAASEEFGQTRMATHGAKPGGLDSGAALREFKDQTSQRFATQEEAFESFVLRTIELVLDVCKDLGDAAPTTIRRSRFGTRKIKWSDVDMGEVRVQIQAAAALPRTPAGRQQFVLELAQAGIVSTEAAARLLQHPDAEREISLFVAAIEAIEYDFDAIADGETVVPEPFHHHEACVTRGQREYLQWRNNGAPEEVLENLRQYIVLAAWMMEQQAGPAAGAGAPMPGEMPPDMADPALMSPAGGQPTAALAPEAMQLQAG